MAAWWKRALPSLGPGTSDCVCCSPRLLLLHDMNRMKIKHYKWDYTVHMVVSWRSHRYDQERQIGSIIDQGYCRGILHDRKRDTPITRTRNVGLSVSLTKATVMGCCMIEKGTLPSLGTGTSDYGIVHQGCYCWMTWIEWIEWKSSIISEIIEYTWLRTDAPITRTRNVGLCV
jgi:hypothetical protein